MKRVFTLAWYAILQQWKKIPLIGGLADCTYKDHKKAAKEFFFALLFSTVTFWLSAFVLKVFRANAEKGYFDLLHSTLSNGELLIFAVSFLGPIFLIALSDRQGKREFPGREWHILALMCVASIAAVLFAQVKTAHDTSDGLTFLNMSFVVIASYWLAGGALLLRYLTMVYQKSMLASDELMPKHDKDFARNYAAHAERKRAA